MVMKQNAGVKLENLRGGERHHCGLSLDNFGWLLKPETGECGRNDFGQSAVGCSVFRNSLTAVNFSPIQHSCITN